MLGVWPTALHFLYFREAHLAFPPDPTLTQKHTAPDMEWAAHVHTSAGCVDHSWQGVWLPVAQRAQQAGLRVASTAPAIVPTPHSPGPAMSV